MDLRETFERSQQGEPDGALKLVTLAEEKLAACDMMIDAAVCQHGRARTVADGVSQPII